MNALLEMILQYGIKLSNRHANPIVSVRVLADNAQRVLVVGDQARAYSKNNSFEFIREQLGVYHLLLPQVILGIEYSGQNELAVIVNTKGLMTDNFEEKIRA